MSRTIWVGAVAYDPKVVGIWEGMRRYFHEEASLPCRGRAVPELRGAGRRPPRLARRAAAAHRHRMEYEPRFYPGRCLERPPLPAYRDARYRRGLDDQDRRGNRRAGGQACRSQEPHSGARQPRQRPCGDPSGLFSAARGNGRGEGLPRRCASTPTSASTATPAQASPTSFARFSTAAPMPARSAAHSGTPCGASAWCRKVRSQRSGPRGPINHCMFTARSDLDPALEQQFAKALFGMSYDNPTHRPVLEAEGLRQWIAPQLEAYAELREASAQQGFLKRP